jgi:hypothetical protein
LHVKYGNINNIKKNLGNKFNVLHEPSFLPLLSITKLTLLEVLMKPTFSFDPVKTIHTYIQVDPDVPGPSLHLLREFLHHIVYDVQFACIAAQTSRAQANYMALTPLSVQAHRYVSPICRQPPNYTALPLNSVEDVFRAPINLQKYVLGENSRLLVGTTCEKVWALHSVLLRQGVPLLVSATTGLRTARRCWISGSISVGNLLVQAAVSASIPLTGLRSALLYNLNDTSFL